MSYQENIIAVEWKDAKSPVGSFNQINPTEESVIPEQYEIPGFRELCTAIYTIQEAVAINSISPSKITSLFPVIAYRGISVVGLIGLMLRFMALQSYDIVFINRLPEVFRNKNPIWENMATNHHRMVKWR